MPVYEGAFDYDSQYYDKYANAWPADWMPSGEMLSWALPEGVLNSAGWVEGFVYFQRVDKNAGLVRFEASLAVADHPSNQLAKVAIPFVIVD